MTERLRRAILIFISIATAFAIGDAVLAPGPVPKDPGFIDTVLGSRAVVAAIRLALIFAAAFVVASVVALIARGRWLTRVGPVEVSDEVSELSLGSWQRNDLSATMEECVDALKQELAQSDRLVQQVRRDQEELDGHQGDRSAAGTEQDRPREDRGGHEMGST